MIRKEREQIISLLLDMRNEVEWVQHQIGINQEKLKEVDTRLHKVQEIHEKLQHIAHLEAQEYEDQLERQLMERVNDED
jgi:D-serine dehydratase